MPTVETISFRVVTRTKMRGASPVDRGGGKGAAIVAAGNGEGKGARVIGDASVDPSDFAAVIEQVLDVDLEMILGLDKCVVCARKKRQGLSRPCTPVGAYIDDVLRIEAVALEQGKERLQAVGGWGNTDVREGSLSHNAIAEFVEGRLNQFFQHRHPLLTSKRLTHRLPTSLGRIPYIKRRTMRRRRGPG